MKKTLLLQAAILLLSGCVSITLAQAGGGAGGSGAGSGGQAGSGSTSTTGGGGNASGAMPDSNMPGGVQGTASQKTDATGTHPIGTPQSDTTGNGHNRTIEGCISQDNGNYFLTEKKNGHRIQLQAGSTDLSAHVGHEVKVHGSEMAGNAATMSSTDTDTMGKKGNKTKGEKTMTVDKVDMVSESCSGKAAGSSTKSPY